LGFLTGEIDVDDVVFLEIGAVDFKPAADLAFVGEDEKIFGGLACSV